MFLRSVRGWFPSSGVEPFEVEEAAVDANVETNLMDTAALEELNPHKFFDSACVDIGRVVNCEQAWAVFTTTILTPVS